MQYYKTKHNGNFALDNTYKEASKAIVLSDSAYISMSTPDTIPECWEEITEEEWSYIAEETTMPLTQNHPTQQEIINAEVLLNQVELLAMQKNIISLLNNKGGN